MTPEQHKGLTREYYGSLVGAVAIVAFGFVVSGAQVPPMGYYWMSLFTVITAEGRRIYNALRIINPPTEAS